MSKRSRRRASARRKTRRKTQQHPTVASRTVTQHEYRYVLADLKQIGILAVVMVTALVALSFLLP